MLVTAFGGAVLVSSSAEDPKHVTKERSIKALDPAVLEAMLRMQATVAVLEKVQR